MSKAPYEERVKWVNENMDNIVAMEKEFMVKAVNKFFFCFAAFSLIIKKLQAEPNYPVSLPIRRIVCNFFLSAISFCLQFI